MKRSELIKHLTAHGCQLLREGGRHSIWWNSANRKTSAVPRHWVPEIFMWDELSAASVLDPSLITETREMYIDVDIDHGVQYGYTLAWEQGQHEPPGVGKAIVHVDVDLDRFYDLYVELMTHVALRHDAASSTNFIEGSNLPPAIRTLRATWISRSY